MASIFLSYARGDAAKAGRIARTLEAAGHQVWWDRHIGAGARFSKEIDTALRAADLVVVLWSRASIESAWVQDEAAFGRDHGRLLPVLIDQVDPPLGFRQFQALPLTGGLRAGSRGLESLRAAIDARLADPSAPITGTRRFHLPRRWLAIGGLVAVILLASLWFLPRRDDGSTTIAVAAANGADPAQSRDFARHVAADLGRYRAGPAGALSIVDGESSAARNADYLVNVGLSGRAADLRVDVSLESRSRSQLLWSSAIEGGGQRLVDLRQQVASQIGDVLRCMAELQQAGGPPSGEGEGLYLNGCAIQQPNDEAISIFRQITKLAPQFGPGWANLALIERWQIPTATRTERQAIFAGIYDHRDRAKALAPHLPETFAADALIRNPDAQRIPAALAILDRGVRHNPDSALLHRLRSEQLLDAGLMRDAVGAARRASELNPLSTAMRDIYISALAYAGRSGEAFAELRKAEESWPGSQVLQDVRFRLSLRFGDPREALLLLPASGPGGVTSDPTDQAWREFLEARQDPRPARIEKALNRFRARYARNQSDVPGYLQALGTFGKIEEAYRIVQSPVTQDSLYVSSGVLFRPYMAKFRADPRFIALSARLGLLQFWEKTRTWPDFCADPQLPYDCAEEARKLTQEQRTPAPFLS